MSEIEIQENIKRLKSNLKIIGFGFILGLAFWTGYFIPHAKAGYFNQGDVSGTFYENGTSENDFVNFNNATTTVDNSYGGVIVLATSTSTSVLGAMTFINTVSLVQLNDSNSSQTMSLAVHCDIGGVVTTGSSNNVTLLANQRATSTVYSLTAPFPCNNQDPAFEYIKFDFQPGGGGTGIKTYGTDVNNISSFYMVSYSGTPLYNYLPLIAINFDITVPEAPNPPSSGQLFGYYSPQLCNKIVFVYFCQFATIISTDYSGSNSATPLSLTLELGNSTSTIPIFSDNLLHKYFTQTQLDLLKTLIGWSLWVGFCLYVFARIKSLWQNSEPGD